MRAGLRKLIIGFVIVIGPIQAPQTEGYKTLQAAFYYVHALNSATKLYGPAPSIRLIFRP